MLNNASQLESIPTIHLFYDKSQNSCFTCYEYTEKIGHPLTVLVKCMNNLSTIAKHFCQHIVFFFFKTEIRLKICTNHA